MDKRILVIDDTKNIRLMISKSLSLDGYVVDQASEGYEGIELFKNNSYELIIVDIRMPQLSGTEVLKVIKAINTEIPVVIITAFPTVKNAVECIKVGAVDYLRKPFTPDKIREIVKSILNRKELTAEQAEGYESFMEYAKKCINSQNFDEAINYLKKAIAINIESAEPFNLLGTILEYQEDYASAEKYYRIANQLEPKNEIVIENLQRVEKISISGN